MRCLWEKGVDDELMKLIEEFSNRVNPKLKKTFLPWQKLKLLVFNRVLNWTVFQVNCLLGAFNLDKN